MKKHSDKQEIEKLLEIMATLRNPVGGCPWDLQQNFASIAPYTIEEAYEVADCIERDALDELPDELGDLLLQVVFHARMAEEQGLFGFADVVGRICDKMIRRHPHVFGTDSAESGDEVVASWEAIKQRERGGEQRQLDGIALGLPALMRSYKLGKRAAAVGFDWKALAPVRARLGDELAELDAAVAAGDRPAIEDEIGDVLFSTVNLCRHLKIDPERALRRCCDRFVARFNRVEDEVIAAGGDWAGFDEDMLDAMWERAKNQLRKQ